MTKCYDNSGKLVAEEGFEPPTLPGNIGRFYLLIVTATILQLLATPALASDPWDTTDKVLFGAGLLSSGADMISTHKFLKGEGHEEWNPVLGERPSDGQLALYWAGLAVIHYLVADYLPNEWYGRKAYLIVVIAAHAAAAHHNTVACEIRW